MRPDEAEVMHAGRAGRSAVAAAAGQATRPQRQEAGSARTMRRLARITEQVAAGNPCSPDQPVAAAPEAVQPPSTATSSRIRATPIPNAAFGAVCELPAGADLRAVIRSRHLSDELSAVLWEHSLLVIKGQHELPPAELAGLTWSFDPEARSVWRDQGFDVWEVEKARDRKGNGFGTGAGTGAVATAGTPFRADWLPAVDAESLSVSEGFSGALAIGQGEVTGEQYSGGGGRLGGGYTRRPSFNSSLQWHVDGAFWNTLPPAVSCLRCVEAPPPRPISIDMDLGTPLDFAAGATAYASDRIAYELLTADEQEWARGVDVVYNYDPFKATVGRPMSSNGLRVVETEQQPSSSEDAKPSPTPESEAGDGVMVHPLVRTPLQYYSSHSIIQHGPCLPGERFVLSQRQHSVF